jgi:GTP-binding protein Era
LPLIPPGTRLYPDEELTDANLRFFAAEYLQKSIILSTREEVPHAACVEILDYKELESRHVIEAAIHVETTGQRGILVGSRGTMISRIRRRAEKEMERLTGVAVSYHCHVKVTPRWRDNSRFLREMGYDAG